MKNSELSPVAEKLLEIAFQGASEDLRTHTLREIEDPERLWNNSGWSLAWETFVPEELRAAWRSLSFESRLVAYLCAAEAADHASSHLPD